MSKGKYAIEFDVVRHENGKLSYVMGNQLLVSSLYFMYDTYDFECDYWEWFEDEDTTPELKDVTEFEKEYHVFQYGDVFIHGGIDSYGEYDVEILFEPEYISIEKKK